MEKSINDFIKELKAISPEKRKLPLVINCPNGMQVYPQIKMQFTDDIMFTKDSKVGKMVITWK
jgi:hypothetical protein